MLRRARLAVLIVAVSLQAATPLAAYARVPMLPTSGDLCSAANVAVRAKAAHDAPQRRPAQHDCVQSLCCVGGTSGAGAPPQLAARPVFIEFASVAFPAAMSRAASASIIAAAPARGPPPLA